MWESIGQAAWVIQRMKYRGIRGILVSPEYSSANYWIRFWLGEREFKFMLSPDEFVFNSPNTMACQLIARIDLILDQHGVREKEKAALRVIEV